jgi:excisionase family DNA binding protein
LAGFEVTPVGRFSTDPRGRALLSIQKFKKPIAPAVAISGPRLLNPKAAATYLSMSIDVVRDLIKNKQLPYIQNGRRFLLDRINLDRYIEKIKIGVAA